MTKGESNVDEREREREKQEEQRNECQSLWVMIIIICFVVINNCRQTKPLANRMGGPTRKASQWRFVI